MVKVKVKLYSILYLKNPKYSSWREIELTKGTIFELIKKLGLSQEDVHFMAVNGTMVAKDHQLAEGDEVALFPAISGG